MNIHGHKLKIAKIKDELKQGERKLGTFRYKRLMKWKAMHERIIKDIRKKRAKK